MSEQLKFRFGLDDGVSGPAKNMKTGLESLKKAFGELSTRSRESANAMGEHFKKLGEFNEKLNFSLELFKKIAEPIVAVGEKVFDLGLEFSKATLEGAEFGQKATIAFETMTGSAIQAKSIMKEIVRTAAELPITTQEAVGYATNLITAGFKQEDLKTLITSVSDIRALNPSDSALASDVLTRTFRNVKGQGFLDEREFRELGHIGVSAEKLTANISKYLAIPLSEVREAVSHRQVGVNVGLAAILDTIKQEEGGKIGNLSNKLAETTSGLMSTIKSRFFESVMNLSEGPGFKAFQGVLMNIRDLTDVSTQSGKQLQTTVADTFNAIFTSVFGKFSGEAGQSALLSIFEDIMDVAKKLPDVISAVFEDVGQLLSGFFGSSNAKGWRDLFDPAAIRSLGPAFHDIGSALSTAAGWALDIAKAIGPVLKILGYGAAIGSGAAAGFEVGALGGSLFGPLGTAIGGVAGTVIGGVGGLIGANKVGDELSSDNLPHHASGGITTGQHTAVVGEVPELIAPLPPGGLSSLGGGSKSVSVGEIHVHVGGEGGGHDQSMKEEVRQGTLLALQQILESMNLEMGAGVA